MIEIKNKIRSLNDNRSKKVLEELKTDNLSTVIIGFFGIGSGLRNSKTKINNAF